MTPWLMAGIAFVLVMIPALWLCLRGRIMERLVGLQFGQIVAVLALMSLAIALQRDIYLDTALVLSVLSLASGLVFIRFLERWL